MKFGASFYYGHGNIQEYLTTATAVGVRRLFTSLHISEQDPLYAAQNIAQYIRSLSHDCEIIADVSPRTFSALKAEPTNLTPFARLGITGLRVDYGFSFAEIMTMIYNPFGLKLILNASTIAPEKITDAFSPQQVEFWHNFYPRPETGLSMSWLVERSQAFKDLGFLVGAFLPWLPEARPPLGLGLPSVEQHRSTDIRHSAAELIRSQVVDTILLGDPCSDQNTLIFLRELIEEQITPLRMMPLELSPAELDILSKLHTARPDPAEYVLRSLTSREMAVAGPSISARNNTARPCFTVTVDNERYQRYSGELQVTLCDLPIDARVNVLGRVLEADWPLVPLIMPGSKFRLIL